MPAIVPEGYTRVREAIYALAEIRHAGIEFSQAVKNVREQGFADTRFSREELEASANAVWAEVDADRLHVWIEHTTSGGMLRINPVLLKDLAYVRRYNVGDLSYLRANDLLAFHLKQRFPLKQRQSLPDWATRFQLLVRDADLLKLQLKFRERRKRNHSRPPSAISPGRPSRAAQIKPLMKDIVESGGWAYPKTLKELTNHINRSTPGSRVSETTVARALDELFQDTGDNRFHRPKKTHASPSSRKGPSEPP